MKKYLLLKNISLLLVLIFNTDLYATEKDLYLSSHCKNIDIQDNEDYSSFQDLDSIADKNKSFFVGETHSEAGNYAFKWKLLKYLYKQAGVRVLVIEESYSTCYLLDHYLFLRDSLKYEKILGFFPMGTEEVDFFRKLYRFNQNKKERIIVRGVDAEFDFCNSIATLRLLLKQDETNIEMKKAFNKLQLAEMKEDTLAFALSVLNSIKLNPAQYRSLLGNNYNIFKLVLRGMTCETCIPRSLIVDDIKDREELMYSNYLSIINEFEGSKFFGQFGDMHVCRKLQTEWLWNQNWTSLASRLENFSESPARQQVVCINLFYTNDEDYSSMIIKEDKDLFYKHSSGAFNLFHLGGMNSPFTDLYEKIQFAIVINQNN